MFNLGKVVETIGVHNLRSENGEFDKFVRNSFNRHCNGDWGDLCQEDKWSNDEAVKTGEDRILSKYNFDGETSIYIITEWDRSATTILFPSEY